MKRTHALIDAESATTATTKEIDLKSSQPISRLVIEMKGTNNGSVPTAHPAAMVSLIELVDGSDILMSMSGYEAQALALLQEGVSPYAELNYQNDVSAIAIFELRFGRWLYDKLFAFMPSKFQNPQLRITHNKASGGSAPDAATLSVFADIFDGENISPLGFLSARRVRSYSLTSSAEEPTQLPTDRLLRRLMVLSRAAGKQPWEQYNKLKLSVNEDEKVLINNLKTSDLLKFLPGNKPVHEALRVIDVDSETTCYVTPTYDTHLAGNGLNASETTLFFDESYGGSVDMTAGAAGAVDALVSGKAPHGGLVIPMGMQNEPDDWADFRSADKLEMKITAGSSVGSSSTASLVVEQLRRY